MIATLRGAVTSYVERRPAAWRWVLACGWAGFLWWLSSHPTAGGSPGILIVIAFNAGHVFLFGTLAALVHLAGSAREPGAIARALCAAASWGLIDEWHQSYVPGRQSSLWDVGTDVAGALLFASIVAVLRGEGVRWPRITIPLALIAATVTVSGASFA